MPITAGRPPYTLGKEGAVAEIGLEFPPVSFPELVGDSGGGRPDDSVIRDSEYVKSSDCARFVKERGLENCSFNLASRSESDPRLIASSVCLAREGMPEPCARILSAKVVIKLHIFTHDRRQRGPVLLSRVCHKSILTVFLLFEVIDIGWSIEQSLHVWRRASETEATVRIMNRAPKVGRF